MIHVFFMCLFRMKTRRSSELEASDHGRPVKRSRPCEEESAPKPQLESSRITNQEDEILIAWSPVRVIRIPER